jgi:hypothetical protein
MEDLVLIEFAARLEEDYHRIHPGRREENPVLRKESKEAPVDIHSEEHVPLEEPVQYEPAPTPTEN